ncbi:MAG: NADAR family protein [Myxococcales bacterium]
MTDLPLSRSDLETASRRGERFNYLCFWGHRRRADGRLTETCFSQWYPTGFEVAGVRYATAEHYMMAEKARLFGDEAALERILQAPSPGAAKSLGRTVQGFDEQRWNAQRFEIVVAGNLAKFSQHRDLGAFLRATKQRVLVEASPVDRIWGIGLSRDDPRAERPEQWRGLNLLGFALMVVRRGLQEA